MIRIYRQEGKKRKIVASCSDMALTQVITRMRAIADNELAIRGTQTLYKQDATGCTEFHVGDVVFFYWIIGKNADARGYLKDRK